ncbi:MULTISPECIES: CbiX/SirB N-terminal domain-containing protein [unclassified Variovorax]|uniref:sirohydrochlorin chelatase n=1 Tax=unclassified Variovorax TaxID=663243 RepID=UPI00076CD74C|nr:MULTISPECIES: CbiX/SirB N-terminal domain-containing protein [unclassified Variovorax]KWT65729.1 Sirohydrochlorin cobaltochelatase [Variovorax sp. WDL1]PNG56756.1 Sirohydrochlorin cobaltochelatase [Variovorax sp. B4]PNG58180.1 Sirohydrochlorin cobaltochelatase [Variovorax sp. B2]VTV09312.1 Sirohydrochlorin cobaltochelatase [Variovorax sp. WDL1]
MEERTLGIVLLAHGSRDVRWRAPVEAVARRVADLDPAVQVRSAYLELSQPDLRTAMAELVAGGAGAVRVVPLFLGMGKHLREDLPRLLEELRASHPQVPVELARTVGEEPEVLDLLARLALGS